MERFDYSRFYQIIPAQKHYAWGSETKIQSILGLEKNGKPLAEIWMGNHPNGMSYLDIEGKKVAVSDFIAENPEKAMGKECLDKFGSLPFLFKLLAAEKPLSIQAHPDLETAESGFERDERNHIPMDHFTRVVIPYAWLPGEENHPEKTISTQKTTQKTENHPENHPTNRAYKQALIIEQLTKNPKLSRRQLGEILGLSADSVKWYIQQMQESGYIRRIGPDKGGHWEIIEK